MADVTNLAQVTEGGIFCATFPEIKDALAQKMQEIYGYDIDLSTASADGQYVMMEALLLNNIYRTLESIENNLSIATATGKYLDILSNLAGIFRRQATYSTVSLYVENTGNVAQTPTSLQFLDKNGIVWNWQKQYGFTVVTFPSKTIVSIEAICEISGPINAVGGGLIADGKSLSAIFSDDSLRNSGDIFQCLTSGYAVYQDKNAIAGQEIESDSELRERRFQSLGIGGSTSIDALKSQLINIQGVVDCFVYNNTSNVDDSLTGKLNNYDESIVKPHAIYPVIAIEPNVEISDYDIAFCIYRNLPFGIKSSVNTTVNVYGGQYKTYDFNDGQGLSIISGNTVVWKQCEYQKAYLEFMLDSKNKNEQLSSDQISTIQSSVVEYMNNISLSNCFLSDELSLIINNILISTGFRLSLRSRAGVVSETSPINRSLYFVTRIAPVSGTEGAFRMWPAKVYLPLTRFYYNRNDVNPVSTQNNNDYYRYTFSFGGETDYFKTNEWRYPTT